MASASPDLAEQRRVLQHMAVFSQYGRAMLAVQMFEAQLALAAQAASIEPSRRIGSHKRFVKLMHKWLDRSLHWYWRASPSESWKAASVILPEELKEQVEEAIKWRGRLAHRYLREKLILGTSGEFPAGTLDELVKLTHGFEKLGRAILLDVQKYLAPMADGDGPPPPIAEALERAMLEVLRGGEEAPGGAQGGTADPAS